ncbi:type I restriction endonuclease [Gordonia sp. (in: high G+C Gram-positive bacteria)]|uniref:type I restriction endonuclease n=2 Tax=Gordonia TaxID=2053 RepID=UPI00262344E0|nr:type I restriction endonuclease [Gordonia sp. (in: high G+C Gram-positive bacteria)]
MSTAEAVKALASKVRAIQDSIETEEATKNAFIMPFISNVLGYDVFDPTEVVPEFTADVGLKKGEKVDYAVFHNGEVQILIECKPIGAPLDLKHASQLFRYFSVTSARIAILTNGREYRVFTDGDLPNRMDDKPFLVFDLLDIDRSLLPEIEKLAKDSFDLDSVINAAQELKYVGGIRRVIANEVKDPSPEWVRYFVGRVYDGKATQRVLDQFRPLVAQALSQYIGAQVNERLKTALGEEATSIENETPEPRRVTDTSHVAPSNDSPTDPDIVTTDEELEGFNIVRAIAVSEVAPERVVYRDSKSYFAVLLDDNNRKPIIRLHLNGKSVKFVTTFENGKDGTRHDIETVVDIYRIAEQVRLTIRNYE